MTQPPGVCAYSSEERRAEVIARLGLARHHITLQLSANLTGLAMQVVREVLMHPDPRPKATQIGRVFGSLRTLERHFSKEALPPPQRLVVLTRWLPVAAVLSDDALRACNVALALGFSSEGQFYKAALREVHMRVPELRSKGGQNRIERDLLTAYVAGGITG
jgi:methylphosphotriester-DNA--protein-cysteine methyltransferase